MSLGNTSSSQHSQDANENLSHAGKSEYSASTSIKSKTTALILCLLLGGVGGHLYYVGRTGKGILYTCTLGLCGIGAIIDLISILTGKFKDNTGALLLK